MMNKRTRLIAAILSFVLLLAAFPVSAVALDTDATTSGSLASPSVLWEEDFESFENGHKLTDNEAGFGAVPYVNEIATVTGNNELRFPLVAADLSAPSTVPTTVGKFFQLPHGALPTDRLISIKARFYPHGVKGTQPNIGIWLQAYKYRDYAGAEQSGKWGQLFNVDLNTGALLLPTSATVTGTAALTPKAWNDVEVVFNPADGSYLIYVNDALYATNKLTASAGYDFKIPAKNILLVSNGNNNADGVTLDTDADDYSKMNYLATDDWCISTMTATADGKTSILPSYSADFEALTVGNAPGFPSTSTGSLSNPGTVARETNGNKYWSVPFSGANSDKGKVNYDQKGYVNNPLIHHAHASTVVFSTSYYIPEGERGVVEGRFGKAFCTFKNADGTETENQQIVWLNLWRLTYLDETGSVTVSPGGANTGGSFVATDAKGKWIKLSATVNMKNGEYTIALNDTPIVSDATMIAQYKATNWVHGKLRDLVILPGEFIPFSSHTSTPADADTWIGVDDISIAPPDTVTVTVDGEARNVYKNSVIDLTPAAGKEFLWATITPKGGESYMTYEKTVGAKDGLSVEVRAVDFSAMDPVLRIDAHLGIRFLSKISTADLEALRTDAFVKSVELGTTIVPGLYKGISPDVFSPEALAGMKYIHIPIENDNFYTAIPQKGYSVFAASVVDIQEHNYNLGFSGVGYLRITLNDEENTVRTLYTASGLDATSVSFAQLSHEAILSGLLTPALVKTLTPVAEAYKPDMTEQMQKDMKDLCVLAIGDSTFWGDQYAWEYQWINWMAKDCDWALSNISHGGESISYRETQNQTSIVNRLFNEPEYKFGGSNSSVSPYRYTNEKALGRSAEEVDLILITAGHNDFGGASIYAPRGELTLENRDISTYIGAWNVVLEELLVRYPNAKIVIVNQWYLTSTASAQRGDDLTRYEFTNSIAEMYRKYYYSYDRIHLLEAGDPRISGVDMTDADFRAKYSRNPGDQFHLNPEGMKIMKDAMLPYIWDLAVRQQKEK